MLEKQKILIIEDDPIFQTILGAIFSDYSVSTSESAEDGIQLIEVFLPDLIIMDINLPGIDGYEACKQLRELDCAREIPVLFISEYQGLDDRLKAYGVGGNDYFTKPINNQEVILKVEKLLSVKKEKQVLEQQLNESYSIVMDMQTTAGYLQVISRFLINMLYCHDMDRVADIFFRAAKGMNMNCVLYLHTEDKEILQSTTGTISRLEEEIIQLSGQLDRIYSFGNNRVIFNWKYASVLVRNLDDKIDIGAILMDGMEAGIRAVTQQQELLKMVSEVDSENQMIGQRITNLCGEMGQHLQSTFLSLGMVVSLDIEEEDRLNEDVNVYTEKISEELSQLKGNNEKIAYLINELSELSGEEDDALELDDEVDDGLDFF